MRTVFLAASLLIAAVASAPVSANPADVDAQAFYTDAKALLSKGMRAAFDPRTKPRMAQLQAAGEAARAANAAATRKGQPLYCVPEAARKKGLNPKDSLAILERVSPSERTGMSLRKAWLLGLTRTYPC